MIKRGEVYWVNLDPTVGAEIRKTRPGLVVSNDTNNLHAQTVTVLPLTSRVERVYPFEVLLRPGTFGNREASKAKANQIRTVDIQRLGKVIGTVPDEIMEAVDEAIRLHLGL